MNAPLDPACTWHSVTDALFAAERACAAAAAPDLSPVPIEQVAVQVPYPEVADALARIAPAVVRLGTAEDAASVVVVRSGPAWCTVLDPALRRRRVRTEALVAAVRAPTLEALGARAAAILQGSPPAVADALARSWLADADVALGVVVRLREDAPVSALLREARVYRYVTTLFALQGLTLALGLAGWFVGAGAALQGALTGDDVVAWLLLAVSAMPFGLAASYVRSELALRVGALFRRRLLLGVTRLRAEEARADGVGSHLGRMLDADAVEALAATAGIAGITALLDVGVVAVVLAAGGLLPPLAWGVCVVSFLALAWREARRREVESDARLVVTRGMVERMLGHGTRVVALPPERWHDDEDAELDTYATAARAGDDVSVASGAVITVGWILLGLASLLPAVLTGETGGVMALAVGGVLLGSGVLGSLDLGAREVVAVHLAWRRLRPLWEAAARAPLAGDPVSAAAVGAPLPRSPAPLADPPPADPAPADIVLTAEGLTLRHAGRAAPVLDGLDLTLRRGDRVLLLGASGAGKSTLAAVLAGLRRPDTGLLLLRGLDLPSVGEAAWARQVATAPQFHENHVFSESLLFNLALGCGWPVMPGVADEAGVVCEELGLGPLLARMPAGLRQVVGETGWQLSHGEQSRVFLARALLQGSQVVILDESFAALDPESLAEALGAARRRAATLVVIAHP